MAIDAKTVLVIEDDPLVQAVIRKHLTNYGYNIYVAEDPIAAKKIVDEYDGDIDMLIVDSGLPVVSGDKVAAEVKERFPSMRVLIISGYPEGRRHEDSPNIEFPFLQKPFSGSQLMEKVEQLFSEPT